MTKVIWKNVFSIGIISVALSGCTMSGDQKHYDSETKLDILCAEKGHHEALAAAKTKGKDLSVIEVKDICGTSVDVIVKTPSSHKLGTSGIERKGLPRRPNFPKNFEPPSRLIHEDQMIKKGVGPTIGISKTWK